MIYFARHSNGSIKIGLAKDRKRIMMALRHDYGAEPILLAMMPGDRSKKFAIHKRFSHLRIDYTHSFQPGPDLLAFIAEQQQRSATG